MQVWVYNVNSGVGRVAEWPSPIQGLENVAVALVDCAVETGVSVDDNVAGLHMYELTNGIKDSYAHEDLNALDVSTILRCIHEARCIEADLKA